MLPRQAYLDAADLLERVGWCQGAYQRGNALCVVTALTLQDPNAPKLECDYQEKDTGHLAKTFDFFEIYDWQRENLQDFAKFVWNSDYVSSLEAWNNLSGQTQTNVCEKLRDFANGWW